MLALGDQSLARPRTRSHSSLTATTLVCKRLYYLTPVAVEKLSQLPVSSGLGLSAVIERP
jgi:hypothetical protein